MALKITKLEILKFKLHAIPIRNVKIWALANVVSDCHISVYPKAVYIDYA